MRTEKANERRKGILGRLRAQLKSGIKKRGAAEEKLTDSDVKRINAEIKSLEGRVSP